MPARVLFLLLGLVVLVLVATSIITGDAAIVAAAVVFVAFIAIFAALNVFLAKRSGGTGDRDDAVPSAHLSPGADDRPLGDTPEAHDEISPHDLPVGHPGRPAAERQAGGEGGTTQGHQDGGAASADERLGERA